MPELVALDLPAGDAFVDALRRAWDGGHAVLPVDPRLPRPAVERLFGSLRPSVVVDRAGSHRRPGGGLPTEEGDALVVATSGTTGEPKGVVLTHQAVRASAVATSERLGVDPAGDRWVGCLPLAHIGGLSVVTRALATGTPFTLLERFDADAVEHEARLGATLISLVATALRRTDASGYRAVLLGGAAPPGRVPGNVIATYGMTETGSGVVYDGTPLAGVEVRIGDGGSPGGVGAVGDGSSGAVGGGERSRVAAGAAGGDGRSAGAVGGGGERSRVAAGAAGGEVQVRGPMLLRAYRDGTDPKLAGGWLPTGDAGTVGVDGTLTVFGRMADVVVTGGEKVWPAAVERVVGGHPAVAEVAVGKRPDPEWGERVVAWVVATDPAAPPTLDMLRSLVGEQLAPWAAPKELVVVEVLPRTPSGKVHRAALR